MPQPVILFIVAVLASGCAAQTSQSASARTYSVSTISYVDVPIDQATVFSLVEVSSDIEGSADAVRNASQISSNIMQILAWTSPSNITNIQETGVIVNITTNETCGYFVKECRSVVVGYSAQNIISFNAPSDVVNKAILDILALDGTSIQSQRPFIPPTVYAEAQNTAIKNALAYAQYRAEQTVSSLPRVTLGLPVAVVATASEHLVPGGSAKGAIKAVAEVTYELITLP